MSYILEAKSVIRNEIDGILEAESKLDESFDRLISTISSSSGRVVMCGMGKSGHIAKKIFATLVSTGTPSMYMHPAEAFHGDLGMVKSEDIFFAISNSGETAEVTQLLPFIRSNGNTLVSMTGNTNSTLASVSDYHLDIGVQKEACPLNLAPTTSTTVSLVLGDAIAVALMKARSFKEENFAKYHPGGSLGRKLLMTVKDDLNEGTYVKDSDSFIDVISAMSTSKTGSVLVGNSENLLGIITDGDIRNYLSEVKGNKYLDTVASQLMTPNPKTISSITKCSDADKKMSIDGVNSLVVKDGNKVLGIYDNLNRK